MEHKKMLKLCNFKIEHIILLVHEIIKSNRRDRR